MAPASPRKPNRSGKKKAWRKPAIKTGQLFEANSLSCGKSNPGLEQCLNFAQQS